MNIAVINAKDLFKYILKFLAVMLILILLLKVLKNIKNINVNMNNGEVIKQTIETTSNNINKKAFTECLDISLSIFSYKKDNNNTNKILSNQKILAMGAGIFDESIFENTDLIINENEVTIDDEEELANQIAEIPKDAKTESVEENNITPKFTTSYKDVKINNQSDYDLTEEMLVPNIEITNKKDVLIYHTHTSESYTPSLRI